MMKLRMNNLQIGIFALLMLFSAPVLFAQQDRDVDIEDIRELRQDAEQAKKTFIETSPEIKELFKTSAGYVIFPNVGKGAWILGGAAGNGVLYEDGQVEGFAEMRQIDVGLQFGGKAYREVIFFQTPQALAEFKRGNFGFEGSASAVILEKGKGKSVKFQNGVGVAIMPKAGAMVGISVGGQEFDYRDAW